MQCLLNGSWKVWHKKGGKIFRFLGQGRPCSFCLAPLSVVLWCPPLQNACTQVSKVNFTREWLVRKILIPIPMPISDCTCKLVCVFGLPAAVWVPLIVRPHSALFLIPLLFPWFLWLSLFLLPRYFPCPVLSRVASSGTRPYTGQYCKRFASLARFWWWLPPCPCSSVASRSQVWTKLAESNVENVLKLSLYASYVLPCWSSLGDVSVCQ